MLLVSNSTLPICVPNKPKFTLKAQTDIDGLRTIEVQMVVRGLQSNETIIPGPGAVDDWILRCRCAHTGRRIMPVITVLNSWIRNHTHHT